jgi:hypothetical protein
MRPRRGWRILFRTLTVDTVFHPPAAQADQETRLYVAHGLHS